MKVRKKMISAGLCMAMVVQTAAVVPAQDLKTAEYEKRESVYAKLAADGTADKAYVVNHFRVEKAGEITDYGKYESVKNLTNLDELQTKEGQTDFSVDEGEFYYQGTMEHAELPWNFKITYQLDGKTVSAQDLGGKSGKLKISFSMKENPKAQEEFFDNYVAQVSLTLDNEKVKNISADGATIADAGGDTQLSFTILPGKEAEYSVEADVKEFAMSGFSIAAVPYSMNIDIGDYETDDPTGQFDELIDATKELNDGMKDLSDGMKELDGNSEALLSGFRELKNGIGTLDSNSDTLLDGSAKIQNALSTIAGSLAQADFSGMSDLKKLPASLEQLSGGLKNLRSGLEKLKQGFDQSYTALDQAMGEASSITLSQEELAALGSGAASDAQAGATLKQAYGSLDAAVNSALGALPDSSDIQKILDQVNGVDPVLYAKLANLYVQAKNLQNTYAEVGPQISSVADGLTDQSSSTQKLLASYGNLQKILGTWNAVKPAFSSVSAALDGKNGESVISGLDSVIGGLDQMSRSLSSSLDGVDIESQMQSLGSGLIQLGNSYSAFHSGLSSYLSGVSSLLDGAGEYQAGLSEYLNGMGEAADGSVTLTDGMKKYSDGVSEIPDKIQEQVDQLMEEYTSTDYNPVSFTDDRNKEIQSVQFVISTEGIKEPDPVEEPETESKKGFWDRLKALF